MDGSTNGTGGFPLTEEGKLFDDSYWRTVSSRRDGKIFVDAFYDRLLASSPEVRAKFAETDFEKQKQVLMLSLAFISAYAGSGQPNAVIEKIALSHGRGGHDIVPEYYDLWLSCLIDTVREYDPEWSPDVESAWRKTMAPGIAYMKAHY